MGERISEFFFEIPALLACELTLKFSAGKFKIY